MANVGGMQRVAMDLHAELERSAEVQLRAHVLRSSWKYIVPKTIPFLTRLLWHLPQLVRAHRAEVVLFSSMTTALPAQRVAPRLRQQGARVAAICHGLDVTEPNPWYQKAVRRTLAQLDGVFPVSRATAARCIERGLEESRVRVVPNGIDLTRFESVWHRTDLAELGAVPSTASEPPASPESPASERLASLERLASPEPLPSHELLETSKLPSLPEGALLCASVGRQVKRKGFSWFVDQVMPKLPAHVHYWLAGDGPEAGQIAHVIHRRGLSDRVRLLGLVDERTLMALYRRADLFVMPNIVVSGDMEGFGVVMLEAGACGLPTLAADLEGIRDVITDSQNGYLRPSGDAEAFAASIRQLDRDRAALLALSDRAIRFVRDRFSWPAVAVQYVGAMRELQPRP